MGFNSAFKVLKFTLQQANKTQECGCRGIALLFL